MKAHNPEAGWVSLGSKEAQAWARIFGTSWRLAIKFMIPHAKDAFGKFLADSTSVKDLSLSKFLERVTPPARYFTHKGVGDALDILSKTKLKVSVFNVGNRPAIIVHRSDLVPKVRGLVGLKRVGDGLVYDLPAKAFNVHRVPYVSDALDETTGVPWLFEADALNQHEVARMVRATRAAVTSPELKTTVQEFLKSSSSPWKVRPHFPVKLPQFARVSHAFTAGRPAGWAAIGAAAASVLSIASFASFLRGHNPGFMASVLWRSPSVALPVGFLINTFWRQHKRRKALRKLKAMMAAAEAEARALAEAREKEFRELLDQREKTRVKRSYALARDAQAVRYGLRGLLRR